MDLHSDPDDAGHWNDVYRDRGAQRVSWFQDEPATSLRLLNQAGLGPDTSLIDVGGGASVLVDRLIEHDVHDITVLDIAETAVNTSRHRLGPAQKHVTWLIQDLLEWQPERRYQLWHDRAVFHFLTTEADRIRYASVLDRALTPDGYAVIATFADDGPERCSGLPVSRYNADTLAQQFPTLHPIHAEREEHHTPSGQIQPFTWLLLGRKANETCANP